MQILKKYKKWNPILEIDKSNVMDFVISNANVCEKNNIITPIAHIDVQDLKCVNNDIILSKLENIWDEAQISDDELKNIGFTGIDNGLIKLDKMLITNDLFVELLKNSTHTLLDNRLKLFPINSNTNTYSTDFEIKHNGESYIKLNGGGFQGFFKTSDNKYQVLPTTIDDTWTLCFTIRPMDYIEKNNTFNNLHPNNKGFFFYIGTRSENKFLNDYNYDFSNYDIRTNVNYEKCENFKNDYFSENYIVDEKIVKNDTLVLNEGPSVKTENYFEITTDNKYLFFNNTKDGLDSEVWNENYTYVLTGITRPNINLYLLLNNTKTGYTVNNIDEYFENYKSKNIDRIIKTDIINNAFGLRVKEDGSIGYRYIVEDCENDKGYKIVEEYSYPNIIAKSEWNDIVVRIKNNGGKMKIYIYINKYLKFVSKELPLLNLRKLDEIDSKQEGVPYNISIGCGTMGLADSITWDYYKPFKYILPIENNFCGTFIGDIKEFKFLVNDINMELLNM